MGGGQGARDGERAAPARRRRAAPFPSSLLQFLEDNDRLIKAVQQCFAAGRTEDAARYQARLHANLLWLAAVADASPGVAPG